MSSATGPTNYGGVCVSLLAGGLLQVMDGIWDLGRGVVWRWTRVPSESWQCHYRPSLRRQTMSPNEGHNRRRGPDDGRREKRQRDLVSQIMGPFPLTIPVLGFQCPPSPPRPVPGQQPTPGSPVGRVAHLDVQLTPSPRFHTGNQLPVCPPRDWAPFCAAARASSRERARADGGAFPCRRCSKTTNREGEGGTI